MPIGEDALGNYAFQVEVDGVTIAQFREASGLSQEISVIEHQENKPGAIPVLKKLPGVAKWGDITLKRGQTNDAGWWEWIKQVQEGKIDEARRNASIVLYDYSRGERLRFNINNAWPSKITVGGLQAAGTEVVVEEVTLVHEGILVEAQA